MEMIVTDEVLGPEITEDFLPPEEPVAPPQGCGEPGCINGLLDDMTPCPKCGAPPESLAADFEPSVPQEGQDSNAEPAEDSEVGEAPDVQQEAENAGGEETAEAVSEPAGDPPAPTRPRPRAVEGTFVINKDIAEAVEDGFSKALEPFTDELKKCYESIHRLKCKAERLEEIISNVKGPQQIFLRAINAQKPQQLSLFDDEAEMAPTPEPEQAELPFTEEPTPESEPSPEPERIPCRGIEIEPGNYSGCSGGEDCPTCGGSGFEPLQAESEPEFVPCRGQWLEAEQAWNGCEENDGCGCKGTGLVPAATYEDDDDPGDAPQGDIYPDEPEAQEGPEEAPDGPDTYYDPEYESALTDGGCD